MLKRCSNCKHCGIDMKAIYRCSILIMECIKRNIIFCIRFGAVGGARIGGKKMANEKRLIDANALKKEIVDFKVNFHSQNQDYGTGYFSALSVVEGMLAYAPTVNAVEVVRCKDCKHCKKYRNRFDPMLNHQLCVRLDTYGWGVDEDDFCSYGERRDVE